MSSKPSLDHGRPINLGKHGGTWARRECRHAQQVLAHSTRHCLESRFLLLRRNPLVASLARSQRMSTAIFSHKGNLHLVLPIVYTTTRASKSANAESANATEARGQSCTWAVHTRTLPDRRFDAMLVIFSDASEQDTVHLKHLEAVPRHQLGVHDLDGGLRHTSDA